MLLRRLTGKDSRLRTANAMTLLAMALFAAAGCGGNPRNRQAVEGHVTLAGEPLTSGNIEFSPQDAAGVSSGAKIDEGDYRIEAPQGLPPGKYIVRIYSAQSDTSPPTPEQVTMPSLMRPGVELVPSRYNSQSELLVDVTDTSAQFNFDLEAK